MPEMQKREPVPKRVNPIVPYMDLKGFKKLTYSNHRSIYEILFDKKEGRFIVGGFSRYLFDTDGNCFNITCRRYLKQRGSLNRIALLNDENIRSTLRLPNILAFINNGGK